MSSSTKPDERMKAEAEQALHTQEDLDCPGFESSRVFALSAQLLANPPQGFPSRKRLVRSLQSIYLFVIQPSSAIDPSNPRTKPVDGKVSTSGGALRPAMWYADMKNKGVIGRGQPPKTVLGRKRKADVVIECRDRDFMELATGKVQAQRLYNEGRVRLAHCPFCSRFEWLLATDVLDRCACCWCLASSVDPMQIKIRGDLDRALKISSLISHERSKIYGTSPASASVEQKVAAVDHEREGHASRNDDYGSGSPAPVPDRHRYRDDQWLRLPDHQRRADRSLLEDL